MFVGQLRWIAFSLATLVALGCGESGPTRVKFTGKITDGGQPLKVPDVGYATVTFIPQFPNPVKKGREADVHGASILPDGTFKIIGLDGNGVHLGKYKVAVEIQQGDADLLKGRFNAEKTPIEKEITAETTHVDIDLPKTKG